MWWLYIIIGILVLLVIFAIVFFVFFNKKKDSIKEQGLSFEKAVEKLKGLEVQILKTYGGREDFDSYVAEVGNDQEKAHICNVLWRLSMQNQRMTDLKYLKSGKNRPSN